MRTSDAIAMIEIQAPPANLVVVMITATPAVAIAPAPLMARLPRQPGSRTRHQCLTMPDCDSVKETKTPTAYSGMRFVTLPPKTMSSSAAAPASNMIPFEKARRSPLNANWRGMNLSFARMADSRGKSAKLVFAARNSTSAVAAW